MRIGCDVFAHRADEPNPQAMEVSTILELFFFIGLSSPK
jgi:hypothetical protein